MIDLNDIEEIYVYQDKCDLRMGIQGLSTLAQSLVDLSNMRHKLFIFFGTCKYNIKILELDSDGWWLYQKRLFEGKYIFPKDMDTITKDELNMMLNGLDMNVYRKHKELTIKHSY